MEHFARNNTKIFGALRLDEMIFLLWLQCEDYTTLELFFHIFEDVFVVFDPKH